MCHPAVAMGFSVLQAGAKYIGERRQAEATYKYKLEKQKLTIASAADAARHQYQGLIDRTAQVRASATQDVNNQLKAYQQAQGRAQVSAAAGGVMGGSVDERSMDFARTFVEARTSRLMNLSWEERQLLAASQGIYAQHRGRQEGTTFAPIAMPSPMVAAAQAGGAMGNIWMNTRNHPMWG